MAREINKLSARRVQTITGPGRYSDGGGLYLIVDPTGAKRWAVYYRAAGKRREMGLGSVLSTPLARARDRATEIRQQVAEGIDPIAARAAQAAPAAEPQVVTFGQIAESYMADRETIWRNPTHRRQWRQTLSVQAESLWRKPVGAIGTNDVLGVLRPIWLEKTETAQRLRGRIERILDAARAGGHTSAENPARWRGHLDAILPRMPKGAKAHHAALPHAQLPGFIAALREQGGSTARMLELIILAAARSGEVRGMVWGELDLGAALWTVPAARMKSKREHRVPLSVRAIEILTDRRLDYSEPADLVFPNLKGRAFSDMTFKALFKRMNVAGITTHGFRSTFRDWAADETEHPREIIEAALAHLVGDDTERAYRRGDALAKRRALMDHWASFAGSGIGSATRPAAERTKETSSA